MLRNILLSKITKHSHVQNNCQHFYNALHYNSHVTHLINHMHFTPNYNILCTISSVYVLHTDIKTNILHMPHAYASRINYTQSNTFLN